jgi:hypothetical protein
MNWNRPDHIYVFGLRWILYERRGDNEATYFRDELPDLVDVDCSPNGFTVAFRVHGDSFEEAVSQLEKSVMLCLGGDDV